MMKTTGIGVDDMSEAVEIMRARLLHLVGTLDDAGISYVYLALESGTIEDKQDIWKYLEHSMNKSIKRGEL